MSDLAAPVEDGKVYQYTSDVAKKRSVKGTDDLGKQEFLTLLVAQMQYQDPLNPSSDTEWISQMASFSSLEQMENMNNTISNSQVFSMIGSTVTIAQDNGKEIEGIVDYVTMSRGVAMLSVQGSLYKVSQVRKLVGPGYIDENLLPYVEKADLAYNHQEPKDLKIKLSMGMDEGAAGGFVVMFSGQDEPIKKEYLEYNDNTGVLTVNKDALKGLDSGTYKVLIGFDDPKATFSVEDVKVTVTGVKPEPEPDPDPEKPDPENPDPGDGDK